MKVKTHKAASKRFHVTKRGKLLKRCAGQDHFNARDEGKITRKKRRDVTISKCYDRSLKKMIIT
ncbi:hypothetical protein A2316_00660 [Candidatus Falkowbacteria bacterium RIFOXYB2_FULL_38_15]|uniref:50S ribosomal protein L35 n=1 Tax=Candidatus Falkowbacteria bacterium RIFOXYA2_FULL_38_12 TaxID=1797993 RepID=A0A1F5S2G8_9BACT|nr:MAG: hypothetical protein A2257_00155 [Candidatus Falkowbacteria bacterium RIFOXYA2_FULL_38_12]OGF32714.1 MAG: hypothetical protein A2316_00660 [Candidatus Falkowbacteria bacterium RIFOXYB2_FULL_38_15]OGF42250.1 MAG: hypothetical protein A2555_03235 [Candidatus Falkowbacteria bacterium RIFOXYD2_FULL_39_16]